MPHISVVLLLLFVASLRGWPLLGMWFVRFGTAFLAFCFLRLLLTSPLLVLSQFRGHLLTKVLDGGLQLCLESNNFLLVCWCIPNALLHHRVVLVLGGLHELVGG